MSYSALQYPFRVGVSTIHNIVKETCTAIWDILLPEVMPVPTEDHWRKIAQQFEEKWHFPGCIGAIDGKHVVMRCPPKTGSFFWNYKGTFSIVLLAVCDADYRFTLVDIGGYGSNSDGGLFQHSTFGQLYNHQLLNIPMEGKILPGFEGEGPVPYCLVGDEAFPHKPDLQRPYSGRGEGGLNLRKRTYNYRLSRARRIIENVFGILTMKFEIYQRRINLSPQMTQLLVQATVVLHNFIRDPSEDIRAVYNRHVAISDGPAVGQNSGIQDLLNLRGSHASKETTRIRDLYAEYFRSPHGSVPWQDESLQFY